MVHRCTVHLTRLRLCAFMRCANRSFAVVAVVFFAPLVALMVTLFVVSRFPPPELTVALTAFRGCAVIVDAVVARFLILASGAMSRNTAFLSFFFDSIAAYRSLSLSFTFASRLSSPGWDVFFVVEEDRSGDEASGDSDSSDDEPENKDSFSLSLPSLSLLELALCFSLPLRCMMFVCIFKFVEYFPFSCRE